MITQYGHRMFKTFTIVYSQSEKNQNLHNHNIIMIIKHFTPTSLISSGNSTLPKRYFFQMSLFLKEHHTFVKIVGYSTIW